MEKHFGDLGGEVEFHECLSQTIRKLQVPEEGLTFDAPE